MVVTAAWPGEACQRGRKGAAGLPLPSSPYIPSFKRGHLEGPFLLRWPSILGWHSFRRFSGGRRRTFSGIKGRWSAGRDGSLCLRAWICTVLGARGWEEVLTRFPVHPCPETVHNSVLQRSAFYVPPRERTALTVAEDAHLHGAGPQPGSTTDLPCDPGPSVPQFPHLQSEGVGTTQCRVLCA